MLHNLGLQVAIFTGGLIEHRNHPCNAGFIQAVPFTLIDTQPPHITHGQVSDLIYDLGQLDHLRSTWIILKPLNHIRLNDHVPLAVIVADVLLIFVPFGFGSDNNVILAILIIENSLGGIDLRAWFVELVFRCIEIDRQGYYHRISINQVIPEGYRPKPIRQGAIFRDGITDIALQGFFLRDACRGFLIELYGVIRRAWYLLKAIVNLRKDGFCFRHVYFLPVLLNVFVFRWPALLNQIIREFT